MSRSNNFSNLEVKTLLSCLESMKDLITVDIGSEFRNVAAQKKAWDDIACIVNSVGAGTERNGKAIKNKWIDLKYRTKKKVAVIKKELLRSGGESPSTIELNEIEERVLQLIENSRIEGTCSRTLTTLCKLKSFSDKGESSTSEQVQNDKQDETSTEVDFSNDGDGERERINKNKEGKISSSTERVRRYRMKIKKQNDDQFGDVVKKQKQTYDSVKFLEARNEEQVENGKTIVKNQEKIINRLDSVVTLMSEISGHMENLNDNVNILIQVIAHKNGIQVIESE